MTNIWKIPQINVGFYGKIIKIIYFYGPFSMVFMGKSSINGKIIYKWNIHLTTLTIMDH